MLYRTGARDEARQVYTSSVNRYQNYEKHLAPLKQSLERETG